MSEGNKKPVGRPPKPNWMVKRNRIVGTMNDQQMAELIAYEEKHPHLVRSDFITDLVLNEIRKGQG